MNKKENVMIILDENHKKELCDRCKYPMNVSGEDLKSICEKCPLVIEETWKKIERECEA